MHWRTMMWTRASGTRPLRPQRCGERAALADAAEQRDMPASARSSQTGVDVNAAQVDGTTALHWAAYNDDAETAALLVQRAPTSTP